jgi:hypothetical protein
MFLSIESIVIEEHYYPRSHVDWHNVLHYTRALETGAKFPPLVVGKRKTDYVLLDGRHRWSAYKKFGAERVGVITSPAPERLWFAEAVRLNISNGIPLSYQERLEAAMRLHRAKLEKGEIAKLIGIPEIELFAAVKERGGWLKPEHVKPVILKGPIAKVVKERGGDWLKGEGEKIATVQQSLGAFSSTERMILEATTLLEANLVSDSEAGVTAVKALIVACNEWLKKH